MASKNLENLPYVPLVPYNGTTATGGDSLTQDLNIYYQSGDIAWQVALDTTHLRNKHRHYDSIVRPQADLYPVLE